MHTKLTECVEYVIMNGKPGAGFRDQPRHDRVFAFWKRFWADVLRENGTDKTVSVDDFVRQDRVTALMAPDEVIAMHCYSLFDLGAEAQREHSYFARHYTPEFLAALAAAGARRVMTMEYFSVDKEWRASKAGVSLGHVLCALGLEIARQEGVDAVITAARSDIPASKIAADQGARVLVSGVTLFNTPCHLMAFFPHEFRASSEPHVNELAGHYWEHRVDLIEPAAAPGARPLRSVA